MKYFCLSYFLFLCANAPKDLVGSHIKYRSLSLANGREGMRERRERECERKEREKLVTQNTQEASSVIINIAVEAKKCFEKRQFSLRSYFWDKFWVLFCQLNFNFYFVCSPNIFFSRSVSLTFFGATYTFLFFHFFVEPSLMSVSHDLSFGDIRIKLDQKMIEIIFIEKIDRKASRPKLYICKRLKKTSF